MFVRTVKLTLIICEARYGIQEEIKIVQKENFLKRNCSMGGCCSELSRVIPLITIEHSSALYYRAQIWSCACIQVWHTYHI